MLALPSTLFERAFYSRESQKGNIATSYVAERSEC
jgi:hypothetical protein